MRRVLVPLDGTKLPTSILPDARRLAGPDGELVLFHGVSSAVYDSNSEIYRREGSYSKPAAMEMAQRYLEERTRERPNDVDPHFI